MNARKRQFNRRRFLQTAGMGMAAAAVAGRGLRAADQPTSQQVVAALIGCGGRGMDLLSIHDDPRCTIAAVCDVDEQHTARARERIGKCDVYSDFRHILDRSDIDAVLIATPDHWHAAITVMACQAGKDVYCEKPLCRTIHEGRRMIEAARRYDRVVQMGTQYRSMATTRQVCEWIRNGRLGKVHTVRLSHPPTQSNRRNPDSQPPPGLDWNLWLGPAPWAAYHPKRCHFTYRYFMDYGGGSLADNGVHMFGVVSWAMAADNTGPVSIEATGRQEANNLYDVPVDLHVRFEFADPKFVMDVGSIQWRETQRGLRRRPGHVERFLGVASYRGTSGPFPHARRRTATAAQRQPLRQLARLHRHTAPPRDGRRNRPPHHLLEPPRQHRLPSRPQTELGSSSRAVPRRRAGQSAAAFRLPRTVECLASLFTVSSETTAVVHGNPL